MTKVWVAHECSATVWAVYTEEPTYEDRMFEGLNREEWCVTEMEVVRALDTNSVTCEIGRCNFCGKTDREGVKVIQGPLVAICSDCVHICNVQLEDWENASSTWEYDKESPPNPKGQ